MANKCYYYHSNHNMLEHIDYVTFTELFNKFLLECDYYIELKRFSHTSYLFEFGDYFIKLIITEVNYV